MSKFYICYDEMKNDTILITGSDFIHLKDSLRAKKGDVITLCDGRCGDYQAEIININVSEVEVRIISKLNENQSEPSIKVTLFQGIPKGDKMEFIIQKCVEIGIDRIVPVLTERCVVKLDTISDRKKKTEKWQKIALEAAKQSGRGTVPSVEMPVSFNDAILSIEKVKDKSESPSLSIFAYENEKEKRLYDILPATAEYINIFIGPEGGFCESEANLALEKGLSFVSIGPRVLRTETAGMVLLTIIMYTSGNI